jgi:probable HAF family extracellular repeat protein
MAMSWGIRAFARIMAFVLLAGLPQIAAAEVRYDLTLIPMPDLGQGNRGRGIANVYETVSNSGAVVGFHHMWNKNAAGDDPYTPALYADGKLTPVIATFGGENTTAYAMNGKNHFVGCSSTAQENSHAYVYIDGKLDDLGTLGKQTSCANAINDNDEIVGFVSDTGNWSGRAFVYRDGATKDLNDVIAPDKTIYSGKYTLTDAYGINNKSDILASAFPGNGQGLFVLYSDGKLSAPDRAFQESHRLTEISRLTDKGEFLANDLDPSNTISHAFVFRDGKFQAVTGADDAGSTAYSINENGDIVGGRHTARLSEGRAFLASNGKVEDLNDLVDPSALTVKGKHYVLRYATSINDEGVIAGNASSVGSEIDDAVFILTPKRHGWGLYGALALLAAAIAGYVSFQSKRARAAG